VATRRDARRNHGANRRRMRTLYNEGWRGFTKASGSPRGTRSRTWVRVRARCSGSPPPPLHAFRLGRVTRAPVSARVSTVGVFGALDALNVLEPSARDRRRRLCPCNVGRRNPVWESCRSMTRHPAEAQHRRAVAAWARRSSPEIRRAKGAARWIRARASSWLVCSDATHGERGHQRVEPLKRVHVVHPKAGGRDQRKRLPIPVAALSVQLEP
jgi:hypothetical protein